MSRSPTHELTHHNITNFRVETDDAGTDAVCHSYYTVIQALPGHEPRIILTGRYQDTFDKADGRWRFADRLTYLDQIGSLDGHLHLDRIDIDALIEHDTSDGAEGS